MDHTKSTDPANYDYTSVSLKIRSTITKLSLKSPVTEGVELCKLIPTIYKPVSINKIARYL